MKELQKAQMRLPAEGNPWEYRRVAVGIIAVVKGARIANMYGVVSNEMCGQ